MTKRRNAGGGECFSLSRAPLPEGCCSTVLRSSHTACAAFGPRRRGGFVLTKEPARKNKSLPLLRDQRRIARPSSRRRRRRRHSLRDLKTAAKVQQETSVKHTQCTPFGDDPLQASVAARRAAA